MIERARKQLRDNGVWIDREAALVCTSLIWSGGVYLDELELMASDDGYVIDHVPRSLQDRFRKQDMEGEDYE